MLYFEGFADQGEIGELEEIALEHVDCALGSVPACTCGAIEARNFLKLFRGEVRPEQLLYSQRIAIGRDALA